MTTIKRQSERFRIEGNRLIVTHRFDPRYQHGADGELLNIIQGMAEEAGGRRVILDLHHRRNLPSMLFGVIVTAYERVLSSGGTLVLRILPEHERGADLAGLKRMFEKRVRKTDAEGVEYLEYVSKPPADRRR